MFDRKYNTFFPLSATPSERAILCHPSLKNIYLSSFSLTALYFFYSPNWQLLLGFHKRQKWLCSKIGNKIQANFREYHKENKLPRGQSKLGYFDYIFPFEHWQYTLSNLNNKYIFRVCSTAVSCFYIITLSIAVLLRPCLGMFFFLSFFVFLPFISDFNQYSTFTALLHKIW